MNKGRTKRRKRKCMRMKGSGKRRGKERMRRTMEEEKNEGWLVEGKDELKEREGE